jgi:hypothetical protein
MTKEDQLVTPKSEPTVLDWVKSLFKLKPIPIPESVDVEDQLEITLPPVEIEPVVEETQPDFEPGVRSEGIPVSLKHIRLPVALFLGFLAQFALESRPENVTIAVAIYVLAGVFVGWATWSGDFGLPLPSIVEDEPKRVQVNVTYLVTGSVLMVLTFLASRSNRFTFLNLVFWVGSLTCFLIAFWEGDPPYQKSWNWAKSIWQEKKLDIQIRPWHILVSASILLIVFFRTTQIERVPYEMWSDHAEKLWDVMDVLDGQYSIFFTRNTGREALQFYMAAIVVKFFNTGISFNTLKITTILAGLVTLPYLYLFAKEFGGRYVGLAAVLLAGVAYWPNVISRLGLRFPFYPLFVAPAMYYLMRGLRLKRRNDLILCGFATGFGLHGYSPARVIPICVLVGVMIFLLKGVSKARRREVLIWLVIAGVIAFVVFIPLLGAISKPQMMSIYLDRMVSRMSSSEALILESPLKVLLENLWRGLRMFAWDDGEIWVVSIPFRPLLDWVTGALFHLGVVILFVRFLRTRRWQDLFLLILIPILMLPSILALAFPGENPAPNRASGAIIPVFTVAAIPLVLLPRWTKETFRSRLAQWITISLAIVLFIVAAFSNYNLVFHEFADQHRQNTWNASEIGTAMRGFVETIGSYETARVVRKKHWVDTRLVRIHAGDPGTDYGKWPSELDTVPPYPDQPQLFIVKPDDEEGLERLRELYPDGIARLEESEVEGRDFILYYVFPQESVDLDALKPEP